MSDDIKVEEVVVSDIESEVLDEGKAKIKEADVEAPKDAIDGQAAADEAGDEIKKSAPPKAKAPHPKTKAAALNAMVNQLSAMKKDDLMAAYEKLNLKGDEVNEDDEEMEESTIVDHSAELAELVENEATLSEEFKEKSALIFEAALKSKLKVEIDRIEENYKDELAEEVATTKSELVEKVDSYLNYVVENYMAENKLEISNGLRTEIAEEFMSKLHQVFVESYIEVPESKIDLVDDLSEQVAELEETVNSQIASMMEMTATVQIHERAQAIRECSVGLALTEIDKLNSLAEDLDFESYDSFLGKVKTIRESYFVKEEVKSEKVEFETTAGSVISEDTDSMSGYLDQLRKQY